MGKILNKKEVAVLLVDIRSVQNVGSIFRTSDAVGINKVILGGITPTPLDRFGRKRKDLVKSALGAEESVSWEYSKNIQKTLDEMRKDGFYIVAIEQSKDSVDYKKIKLPKNKILFVLGNEVKGLGKVVLNKADVVAEIHMRGAKESLNVSVSFGVAVFRMLNV